MLHRTILQREDLDALLGQRNGLRVSIYMPTHRTGREQAQGPIRLKNLLRRAAADLTALGVAPTGADEVLAPARALLNEAAFWEHQGDGLALFLGGQEPRSFALPSTFEEQVVVANRFHVKPLLPLLGGDGRFFVLALSQNEVRLLQGTRFSVQELEPEGMPGFLAEALWMDNPERSVQHRTASGRRPGGRGAVIYHGHGANVDAEKPNLLRFFRRVDAPLTRFLGAERAPLVLAGVESHFAIYREANTYPHLLDEGIAGNPETLSNEELHARAWAIVEPRFRREQEERISRYRREAGKGTTSRQVEEIVVAATHGRVESLFVALGDTCWGTWEEEDGGRAVLHAAPEPGDVDLLDLAAARTLKNGGEVYVVSRETVPARAPAAALLRY